MMNTQNTKEAGKTRWYRRISPLVFLASSLSAASLVWTTYSVVDLLGIGPMAFTVAATLDIVWGAILYAEHQHIPLGNWRGKPLRWTTTTIGWLALLAVVALLVWHGISLKGETIAGEVIDEEGSFAVAIAGPLLPIGAKVVWLLAIGRHRDPTDLTPEQKDQMAQQIRAAAFERSQRTLADEARDDEHKALLRKKEQQREQDLADKRAELDRIAIEHKAEMERIEAERQQRMAKAKADLEELKITNEQRKQEAHEKAMLEISEIENQAEIEMTRSTRFLELDIKRMDQVANLERRKPIIIQAPQAQPELPPPPSTPGPPRSHRKTDTTETAQITDYVPYISDDLTNRELGFHLDTTNLTDAEARKKRLAALYYCALAQGQKISKSAFGRRYEVKPVEMTRATNFYTWDAYRRDVRNSSRDSNVRDFPGEGQAAG